MECGKNFHTKYKKKALNPAHRKTIDSKEVIPTNRVPIAVVYTLGMWSEIVASNLDSYSLPELIKLVDRSNPEIDALCRAVERILDRLDRMDEELDYWGNKYGAQEEDE
jgi:hypothetical protein